MTAWESREEYDFIRACSRIWTGRHPSLLNNYLPLQVSRRISHWQLPNTTLTNYMHSQLFKIEIPSWRGELYHIDDSLPKGEERTPLDERIRPSSYPNCVIDRIIPGVIISGLGDELTGWHPFHRRSVAVHVQLIESRRWIHTVLSNKLLNIEQLSCLTYGLYISVYEELTKRCLQGCALPF